MELKNELIYLEGKVHIRELRDWVMAGEGRFDQVWQLMVSEAPPVPRRAAWLIDHCLQEESQWLAPYLGDVLPILKSEDYHDGVKRCLLKHVPNVPIPEDLQGNLYDLCISWVNNPIEPVANRVFAMEVAMRIVQQWPELGEELASVINAHFESASAGFRARGKRILKQIAKL